MHVSIGHGGGIGGLGAIEAESARGEREGDAEALAYANRRLHLRVLRARVAGDVDLADHVLLEGLFELGGVPEDGSREAFVALLVGEIEVPEDAPPIGVRAIPN